MKHFTNRMQSMDKSLKRRGFSLLEILLAIVVLAAVATAVMSYARQPGERVKQHACDLRLQQLQVLVQQYQADYGTLPSSSLAELSGDRYLGEVLPTCPVDGRVYTLDRATGTVVLHGH